MIQQIPHLLNHALHMSQTKFLRVQIQQFCSVILKPINEFENGLLDYLIANDEENPYNFIRNFKAFVVYLNYPKIDSVQYLRVLNVIADEWEGLKMVRNMYYRLMESDEQFTNQKMYQFLSDFENETANFDKNNDSKQVFLTELSKQYGKGTNWLGKVSKILQLNMKFTEIRPDNKRRKQKAKLRSIFINFLKKQSQNLSQTQKTITHLAWLASFTKKIPKQYKQSSNKQDVFLDQSRQQSKSSSQLEQQLHPNPFDQKPLFKTTLVQWNHYSGQAVDLTKFQLFYNAILNKILNEQNVTNGVSDYIIDYLLSESKFITSLMVTCLAIFVQIYCKTTLNTIYARSLFGLPTFQLWKSFCCIISFDALGIPNTLKDDLFIYERNLILNTLTMSDYVSIKQSQSSDSIISSFLQRIDDFLSLRYMQFDKIMKVDFSWFYHRVIRSITSSNIQLLETNFDHLIIFCVYYGSIAMKIKPDIDMLQIIKTYNRFNKKLPNIIQIDKKSIIDIYNNSFNKFVSSSGALTAGEKPTIRWDFLIMMQEQNIN